MPFYTGTTADGSDMREVYGMYVSPDGKYFSNYPFSKKEFKSKDWKNRMKNLIKSKPTE